MTTGLDREGQSVAVLELVGSHLGMLLLWFGNSRLTNLNSPSSSNKHIAA